MKVLEAQSAMLTNYDVYKHLTEQNARHEEFERNFRLKYEKKKAEDDTKERQQIEKLKPSERAAALKEFNGRWKTTKTSERPKNLKTVAKEILDYFEEAPSPLSTQNGKQPIPYDDQTIARLFETLRKYDLTKAEILMILNLRPTKPESLTTIVEEFETRFESEEEQQEMVDLIAEALGRPDGEAERQAMADDAEEARKMDQEAHIREQEQLKMEVDDI